jgi:hypothetical protein
LDSHAAAQWKTFVAPLRRRVRKLYTDLIATRYSKNLAKDRWSVIEVNSRKYPLLIVI